MKKRLLSVSVVGLTAACLWIMVGILGPTRSVAQGGGAKNGPVVIPALYHGVSTPEQRAQSGRASRPHTYIPFLGRHLPPNVAFGAQINQRDFVLQTSSVALFAVLPGLNLAGLGEDFPGYGICCAPSDTTASVGTTQVVEVVNVDYVVFSKSTGLVATAGGPFPLMSLFSSFSTTACGGASGTVQSDPIVKFDQLAGRWVITFIAFGGQVTPPFLQCFAVSTSDDATGTYNTYVFDVSTLGGLLSGQDINDYDKLGLWPDAYYVSWNEFSPSDVFDWVGTCAYDRTAMVAGNSANSVCFLTSRSQFGLLPSDLDGNSGAAGTTAGPPSGSPNFFVGNLDGVNGFDLWKFHVDFGTPANSTFTGPSHLIASAYSIPCGGFAGPCIPQPGTVSLLDTLGDRVMFRNAYRNFTNDNPAHESMVFSHSITDTTPGSCGVAVRWYEVRNPSGTPSIFQQGTFSPDGSCRWMPSISMDRRGDIGLGYSVSDAVSVQPSIRYTGRTPIDGFGTMEKENSIIAGTGVQTDTSNRWGDYSSMVIDPSDDCTFWYAQEYMQASGSFNWSTRLGSFRFWPRCGGPMLLVQPSQLYFSTQNLRTTSPPQAVAISNFGGLPADILNIATAGEFAQQNECGTLLAAGAQCHVQVTFTPTLIGPQKGSLTLNYIAPGVHSVSLVGFGVFPE
jgi:hypothetical protein